MKKLFGVFIAVSFLTIGCGGTVTPELDNTSSNEDNAEVSSEESESSSIESGWGISNSSSSVSDDEETDSSIAEEESESSSSSAPEDEETDSSSSSESDTEEIDSSSSSAPEANDPDSSSSSAPDVVTPSGDAVVIFEDGLVNGFTWRFYGWNTELESVSNVDGTEYSSGDAFLHVGAGHAIPFEQDDGGDVDASGAQGIKFTYSSEEPFKIQIIWGLPLEGTSQEGNPYWSADTYMNGGFLLVEVPASSASTDFSMSFSEMVNPLNDYWVTEQGMSAQDLDLSKVTSLIFRNDEATADFIINNIRFE